jgi:hypothetical protein
MTLIFQLISCGSILLFLVFVIPFWFKAAKAHNELIKFQYENALDAWKKSGEPSGLLGYRAPTQSRNIIKRFFVSNPAFTMLTWVFFTPSWVKDFPDAQNILRKLRRNVLAWNIGVISFVIYFILVLTLFAYGFETGFLK